ncbi:Undecaprenyl phosphate-alpha-4-amino-4-deoxy-L-arabinose arabinosyl transferase [Ceratobasidium theobromae]|uniref:Undecaprenyl phosphate-alpha-4-amino-4-deoxy-L-arabinose arabinosyl transferase n=1 Tax=Ceratobasidium theobromae TaxID=1582974 RepID=A0A5N5Q6L1_9AGAM|nr:Undecaprenyl phosphate-alpha-4-amino-4-deoxy-L-arabinose arabinosyl transferase [Ceratobasidium theobromae]
MVQPESFTRVSVIPEEEEVIVPAVPPRSRTSTEESQRTPEEPPERLYLKEPLPPQQVSDINLSRRGIPIVQEVASRMRQEPITHHNHLPDHIQSRILTSRCLKEMFDDPPPRPPLGGYPPEDPDPYGYSYDDDSSDHRPPPRRPRPPSGPPGPPGPPAGPDPYANPAAARPTDLIPEWDGDPKILPKWVITVNNIAEYSEYTRQQLGQQVPLRFTGRAQRWFTALNRDTRRNITQDWPSLRQAITIHFMNRAYLEQNKREALEMKYRDSGHRNETPEDYVIRKMEALTLFNDWMDPELIFQIMNDAPSSWRAYIDTEDIRSWEEFLDKIYWHQQDLMSGVLSNQPDITNLVHRMESALHKLERRSSKAHVRLHKVETKPPWKKKNKPISWHKDNPKPQFRKHDEVISKGKTPKDKGIVLKPGITLVLFVLTWPK